MITKIELHKPPHAVAWGTGAKRSEASVMKDVYNEAILAQVHYNNACEVLAIIKAQYPRLPLKTILAEAQSTQKITKVHHYSPLKRSFTIGILTITEED